MGRSLCRSFPVIGSIGSETSVFIFPRNQIVLARTKSLAPAVISLGLRYARPLTRVWPLTSVLSVRRGVYFSGFSIGMMIFLTADRHI